MGRASRSKRERKDAEWKLQLAQLLATSAHPFPPSASQPLPVKAELAPPSVVSASTTRFAPIGDIKRIYRFFSDPQFANTLESGGIWISTLETCRRYENLQQGDPEEGFMYYNSGYAHGNSGDPYLQLIAARTGIRIGPGSSGITIQNNTVIHKLPDAYVLCTTELFDPESLSGDFGSHCVEILEPKRFFELVTNKLAQVLHIREAAFGRVIYRPRQYVGLQTPPGPLGFVKPPDRYRDQFEVRLLWTVFDHREIKPFLLEVPEVAALCRRIN